MKQVNNFNFTHLIDLAAERVGGKALDVSDDFFAEKENLLKPGRGIFIEDKYTDRGKWMDGWESRRKREEGHDWCVIQLGLRGVIKGVDIDTNHFLGNHPPFASLQAACVQGLPEENDWVEIIPKSPLQPGSQNLFQVNSLQEWTHVKLHIYPDGGVARLKVYGDVVPDWDKLKDQHQVDLVAVQNGGRVIACNDMFFSSKDNLIMPGRGVNMGDGWETKRKRGPSYQSLDADWVILKLAKPGIIQDVEVDTCHFKGNYPDKCSLEWAFAPGLEDKKCAALQWAPLMNKQKLSADHRHYFKQELLSHNKLTHIRFKIFPDGGVSRLRLNGYFELDENDKS
ncbi:MAG: allantoicase [bacterium]